MQLALSTKVVREGIFLRPGILKVCFIQVYTLAV